MPLTESTQQRFKEPALSIQDLGIGDYPIYFIDTKEQMLAFSALLRNVKWIALDTEFIREKTYYPNLCLIQIATEQFAACIDPIKLENIDLILDIIFDESIVKIMHAGRQDLEILYYLRGSVPQNVFDSQLAAPYLGIIEQISYAGIVLEFTDTKINKSQTRTDWRVRPLTKQQIQYAANDVYYLAQVYTRMLPRLEDKDRLPWLDEEFSKLLAEDNYAHDPDQMWRKIRGYDRLSTTNLTILAALASWREKTSRELNCPRNWLIRDEALMEIARNAPTNNQTLKRVRSLSEKIRQKHGDELIQCIAQASSAKEQIPKPKQFAKLSMEQNALVDILMSLIRCCAVDHDINPSVIASRKELENFLLNKDTSRLSHGWRQQLIGDKLSSMLNGDLAIKIVSNQLVLFNTN